jgi:putative Mg2+ transporter-C (MgtC) family protein
MKMLFWERFLSDFNFDALSFVFDMLAPSLLAIIFGGLIGLQREKHERPAGLRTHSLVCLGATVFTLVSYLGFSGISEVDPSRIAAGIVTGIGFIGAGAIFKQGPLIKGITTAASIWISAAIGLALGTRLYYLAIIVTVSGLLILSFLKNLEERIIHVPFYNIRVTTAMDFGEIDDIKKILAKFSSDIKSKGYEILPDKDQKVYSFHLHSKVTGLPDKIISLMGQNKKILKVSVS